MFNKIIVGVYISPNLYINDIIVFLHGALLKYILDGGKLLPQYDDLKSLILTGDFNVNFASDTSTRAFEQTYNNKSTCYHEAELYGD